MAGVKGKSGGPRKNAGGARPGAGRKPKEPDLCGDKKLQGDDPLVFLTTVMKDPAQDMKLRADAAKALMPFVHLKLGEGGKKDLKKDAAKVAAGRFAPVAVPPLRRRVN